jgi:hypothetical protein
VSVLEPTVVAMGLVVALEPVVEAMEQPVLALEPAVEAMGPVAALEPAVEAMGWPVEAMGRPVLALEAMGPVAALDPVVEKMGPMGMQPCLPLHCHHLQHCYQVVNG